MKRTSIKATAEAVLRELPSVLGAYVSEDLEGQPREVHLLVSSGPDPAGLARDIRGLLQERLGIPIDQRVISIAQLARDEDDDEARDEDEAGEGAEDADVDDAPEAEAAEGSDEALPAPAAAEAVGSEGRTAEGRPVFNGIESTVGAGRVTVTVSLEWHGAETRGTGEAADTTPGRARAAATATLDAAMNVAGSGTLMLELDFASVVQALDGDYALVSVLGVSEHIGRRPLPLVGAHPIDNDVEGAAALASLKAINRILTLALHHA